MIPWTRRAIAALLPLLLTAAIACESGSPADEAPPPPASQPAVPATDSSQPPRPLNTPVLTDPAPTAPRVAEPAPAPESAAKVGHDVGDMVPEFTLTLGSGGTISSQELIDRGQPTFIFFFATWCPICRAELTQMKDIYPEFSDEVAFYLVGQDTTETLDEIIAYKERQGQTWEVAAPNLQLLRDLNVLSQSTKVAFDHNGVIVYRDGYRGGSPDKWRDVFRELIEKKLSSESAPTSEPPAPAAKAVDPPPQAPGPALSTPPVAVPTPPAPLAKSPPEPTPVPPQATTPPLPTPAPAIAAKIGNDVGERVSDFTLTLVSGKMVTSADLIGTGRPTFLFFAATW